MLRRVINSNSHKQSQLKDFLDYPQKVRNIIIYGERYHELLNFTNFSLCKLGSNIMCTMLKVCSKKIIKHVINNLNCYSTLDRHQESLLYDLISSLKNVDLFKYFLEKYYFVLEMENRNGERPINKAIIKNNFDFVTILINKGIDLEYADGYSKLPVHYACVYASLNIIELLVNKGVDLESESRYKWRPIHFVRSEHIYQKESCKHRAIEIIQYLINKGVNLESQTDYGWRPIHFICRYENLECIKYFLSLNVDKNARINKDDNGNDVDYGIRDLLEMNRYISFNEKQELLDMIGN